MKSLKNPGFLGAVVLLQAGLIAGLLADGWRSAVAPRPAYGQMIPDPAAVQMQTNELLRSIDGKLGRLLTVVDGELKVRVVNPPENRGR